MRLCWHRAFDNGAPAFAVLRLHGPGGEGAFYMAKQKDNRDPIRPLRWCTGSAHSPSSDEVEGKSPRAGSFAELPPAAGDTASHDVWTLV